MTADEWVKARLAEAPPPDPVRLDRIAGLLGLAVVPAAVADEAA